MTLNFPYIFHDSVVVWQHSSMLLKCHVFALMLICLTLCSVAVSCNALILISLTLCSVAVSCLYIDVDIFDIMLSCCILSLH